MVEKLLTISISTNWPNAKPGSAMPLISNQLNFKSGQHIGEEAGATSSNESTSRKIHT
jgi:hypothetical protein